MNIAVEDIPLLKLLPQKPPFVMIDKLVSSDGICSVSELEIREDNVFFDKGCLLASGLVENMAQTCAASVGIKKIAAGGNVALGVIGAVTNFDIIRLPQKGEKITTTVKFLEEVFQMSMFDAVIRCGETELAKATIKTALIDVDEKN